MFGLVLPLVMAWPVMVTVMVTVVFTAVSWVFPRLAWACPSCAANNDSGGATLLLVGGMIVLPWIVSWVVYRVIKRSKIFGTEAGELARDLSVTNRDLRRPLA